MSNIDLVHKNLSYKAMQPMFYHLKNVNTHVYKLDIYSYVSGIIFSLYTLC